MYIPLPSSPLTVRKTPAGHLQLMLQEVSAFRDFYCSLSCKVWIVYFVYSYIFVINYIYLYVFIILYICNLLYLYVFIHKTFTHFTKNLIFDVWGRVKPISRYTQWWQKVTCDRHVNRRISKISISLKNFSQLSTPHSCHCPSKTWKKPATASPALPPLLHDAELRLHDSESNVRAFLDRRSSIKWKNM